ncbi:MAG: hypothetical protein Q8Q73_06250 [Stagnimonas sp.]|nr:hypothetical protein [Stagnimonas sp.]
MRFPALLAALLLTSVAQAAPTARWTLSGFDQPESAVYASQQKLIYVASIEGDPASRDGRGYISQVSPEGRLLKKRWYGGLNAPKGLAYYYGLLYVADIDELLEIDTGNGRVKRRFKAPGAKFLNDVAVSGSGVVYVSDTATNTIWRLSGDSFTGIVKSAELQAPNGLLVDKGQLVVASWGKEAQGEAPAEQSWLQAVDLESRAIQPRFSPIPLGNLDGLAPDGKGGYYASDYALGNLFHIASDGEVQLWIPLEQGIADLAILPGKGLLVPNMVSGTLTLFPFDK